MPEAASTLWRESAEIARTLTLALCIALVLRVALFQPFTIPSSSMEPGLVTGDYILVSKFAYGWSRASFPFNPPLFTGRVLGGRPARGDVVVFRLPRDPMQTWIKRVIGLPGDHVQVIAGCVFVNGRPIPRVALGASSDHDAPARAVLQARELLPGGRRYITYASEDGGLADGTDVYIVPAGSYFVMGDNRDNSLDSRFPPDVGVGFLPAANIVGKAEFVLASWRQGSELLAPWTWLRFQPERFFKPVR
jgi:signal peptidase I